jgi:hypothetical protein
MDRINMETSFYGREYELGLLHNRVIRMAGRQNLPSLTWMYGARGMGKSALIDSFVAQTLRRQSSPTILLKPEVSAGMFGVEMFAESMLRSAVLCPSSFTPAVIDAAHQFSLRINALRRVEQSSNAGYSPEGTVRSERGGETAVAGDPGAEQLTELFVESLVTIAEQIAQKSSRPNETLCVILCLDQFPDYSPSVKRWIGALLIQQLMQKPELSVPRALLTGDEPMELSGQIDYWEVPLWRIHEIELKPIGRSSCIKWLVDAGIQPDVIDELMEQTKGVPAEISKLLADRKSIQAMEEEVQELEGGGISSVRQRRWLHAAALLQQFDRESLAVILGEKDARIAYDWLQTQTAGIRLLETAGSARLLVTPVLRKTLLEEGLRRYPDRHKDFEAKIAVQKRVLEKIPQSAHRDYLRQLIPIERFDFDMIDKIYGGHE